MNDIETKVVAFAKENGFITSNDGYKVGTVDVRKVVSDLRRNPNYEVTDDWAYRYDMNGKVVKKWKRYFIKEVLSNG